jgi:hypothetical protein
MVAVGAAVLMGGLGAGAGGSARAATAPAAPTLYRLQLVHRGPGLRAHRGSTIGVAIASADGRAHGGVGSCVRLPRRIRLVRPLQGGRRAGRRSACWSGVSVPASGARVLALRVRPRRPGHRLRIAATLSAPDIVTSTATFRVDVRR